MKSMKLIAFAAVVMIALMALTPLTAAEDAGDKKVVKVEACMEVEKCKDGSCLTMEICTTIIDNSDGDPCP